MSGPGPDEIWQEGIDEGERRMSRSVPALIATGAVGGVDVMLGVMVLAVTSGAISEIAPYEVGHVAGSLVFGIGFVLLIIGRSELFTENFLVPFAAVFARRKGIGDVVRLWVTTLIGNILAIIVVAAILVQAKLVPPSALEAAGHMADTFTERSMGPAFLSAVLAGTTMTLFTWLASAVQLDISRVIIALLIGFVLAAPSLNHAVVSVGEILFGLFAETDKTSTYGDLFQNFGIAVAGNLVGGLGFVTLARGIQARGEPDD